jgi:hypothetical protein
MSWYNGVMFVLTLVGIGILIFLVSGCANIDNMKKAKADAEYRKQLRLINDNEISTNTGYGGPIEMPQEWIDQWPKPTAKPKLYEDIQ